MDYLGKGEVLTKTDLDTFVNTCESAKREKSVHGKHDPLTGMNLLGQSII